MASLQQPLNKREPGSDGSPVIVLSYHQVARLIVCSAVFLVLLLAATFQLGRMSSNADSIKLDAIAVQVPAFPTTAESSRSRSARNAQVEIVGPLLLDERSPVNNISSINPSPDTPRRRVLRSRGRNRSKPKKATEKPVIAEVVPAAEVPAEVTAEAAARAEEKAKAKARAIARVKAKARAKAAAGGTAGVKGEEASGGGEKEVVVAEEKNAAVEAAAKAAEAAAAREAKEAATATAAAAAGDSAPAGGTAGESDASSTGETPAVATPDTPAAAASDTSSSTSPSETTSPSEAAGSIPAESGPAATVDPATYYTEEGLQRLQDPCGSIGSSSSSSDRRCYNRCHRRTRSGYCVKELLSIYDEAYGPLWPARVDLLIRSYVSDNFFLTAFLFASIEQMWPAGIGDVILVLDEKDRHVEDIVPPWVKIYYEKNYLGLSPKLVQQWSYLWADNYTTAPYVAIIDDDVIFNLKVTPGLLFNLTDSKPYVIGSRNTQGKNWRTSSRYFVGPKFYRANFMVQLPFVFPRAVLPKFRAHVGGLHKRRFGNSFDAAFKYWAQRGPVADRTQIAHTTLGNYMWFFANDSAHWAFEWEIHTPIPRVGVHIPHTHDFRNATASSTSLGSPQRLVKTYVDLTGTYAHEGLCNAFPAGELAHCEDASREQGQIWRYALSGSDWAMFQGGEVNGTIMHDHYKWELACMYERVVGAKTGEWKQDVEGKRRELVKELTKHCVVPHSNKY